jgi:hypothetical protein
MNPHPDPHPHPHFFDADPQHCRYVPSPLLGYIGQCHFWDKYEKCEWKKWKCDGIMKKKEKRGIKVKCSRKCRRRNPKSKNMQK